MLVITNNKKPSLINDRYLKNTRNQLLVVTFLRKAKQGKINMSISKISCDREALEAIGILNLTKSLE
jgi:hypothetical protein